AIPHLQAVFEWIQASRQSAHARLIERRSLQPKAAREGLVIGKVSPSEGCARQFWRIYATSSWNSHSSDPGKRPRAPMRHGKAARRQPKVEDLTPEQRKIYDAVPDPLKDLFLAPLPRIDPSVGKKTVDGEVAGRGQEGAG